MAGTTTNFAIPYPSITDYVTDGATAMRSLADQVDAVLFTGSSSGNLLINGAMQVSQRSAVGTAVTGLTTTGYNTADRWVSQIGTIGTWTQTTIADAPTGSGFRNSLKLACTTADASPAGGDFLTVTQKIEGQNLQAIRKGTASAQTLTLSFWVKAFQTGTFIVELRDEDNTRICCKAYTIAVSNTWEYKTVLFPADTTGAFDNDSNSSLTVNWWLGAGSSYTSGTLQTTWAASVDINRAVGQTNLASSTSNTFFLTGTQLTVGSVATPFEFKSFDNDLRDCQRYYQRITASGGDNTFCAGMFLSTTQPIGSFNFPEMRAAPTFNFSNGTYDVVTAGVAPTCTSITGFNATRSTAQLGGTTGGAVNGGGTVYRLDSGFFDLSAEL
jgi:hypothetical protein